MNPIGLMKTPFKFKNGTPRQPTVCSHARGSLTIDKSVFNNPEHSLEGLEDFSHVWILFIFHKNNNAYTKAKVKPPRLNGKKVGLFSTRCPYRPNNIGLSLAKLESVIGATVHVSGIDILDGSPVLDIKPYIPQYDCPSLWISADSIGIEHGGESREELEVMDDMTLIDNDGSASENIKNDIECKMVKTMKAEESNLDGDRMSDKTISKIDAHVLHDAEENTAKSLHNKFENDNLVLVKSDETMKNIGSTHGKIDTISRIGPFCDASKVKPIHDKTISHHDKSGNIKNVATEEDQDSANYIDENLSQDIVTSLENPDVGKISLITCDKQGSKSPEYTSFESDTLTQFKTMPTERWKTDTGTFSQTADWISKPNVEKLCVRFTPTADQQISLFSETSQDDFYRLQFLKNSQAREAITSILHEDPRSTYRRKNCVDSLYYFTVDCFHVTCWFDKNCAEVVRVKPAAFVEHCKSKYT